MARSARVLVTGRSVTIFHRHKWEEVPWNRRKHGSDLDLPKKVSKTTGFYAIYRTHRRCTRCQREEILSERALL